MPKFPTLKTIKQWRQSDLVKTVRAKTAATAVKAALDAAVAGEAHSPETGSKYLTYMEGGPQLFVKTLTGATITVCICRNETVEALKRAIYATQKIPIEQQRIIYSGRQLEDERKLSDYDIPKEATLHLTLALRGGMYHASSGRDGFANPLMRVVQVRDAANIVVETVFVNTNDGTTIGDFMRGIADAFGHAHKRNAESLVGATLLLGRRRQDGSVMEIPFLNIKTNQMKLVNARAGGFLPHTVRTLYNVARETCFVVKML